MQSKSSNLFFFRFFLSLEATDNIPPMSMTIRPHLHHYSPRTGKSTSTSRDWTQIYSIYGMDQWHTLLFLLFHAVFFSILSFIFLLYFDSICFFLESFFGPGGAARFAAGFTGCVMALSAVCLLFSAVNFFYSSLALHLDMARRMVSYVGDWSTVKLALDIVCGRGILLNTVATQLKKTGSCGRVVGLDHSKRTTLSTLRTANMEVHFVKNQMREKRTVKDLKLPPAFVMQIAQSIQTQLTDFRSYEGQHMYTGDKRIAKYTEI